MSACVARDQASMLASSGPGKPKQRCTIFSGTSRETVATTSNTPPAACVAARSAADATSAAVARIAGRSSQLNSVRIAALSRQFCTAPSRASMNGPTDGSMCGA